MPFETERSSTEAGVVVLSLSGTMTMGTQLQRFEWSVEELVKNGQNRIVADLSGVSYLDSSAIGVLVGCHGTAKTAGGQLRLAGLTERVEKILRIGGVDSVLSIDSTRDAALAGLAGS